MKKILSVIALGALIVTSSMGIANAQQGSRSYHGPSRGGWNCPWMGGQGGHAGRGGWGRGWGGNWQGRGYHMGPRAEQSGRGTGGYYGPQYGASR